MLDKLRLILYLILIFIGLIALLYIAPIYNNFVDGDKGFR